MTEPEQLRAAFEAISTRWVETNTQRHILITKKVNRTLTLAEANELDRLQGLASARQNLIAPVGLESLRVAMLPHSPESPDGSSELTKLRADLTVQAELLAQSHEREKALRAEVVALTKENDRLRETIHTTTNEATT